MNASGLAQPPCADPTLASIATRLDAVGWECLGHTACEGDALLVATSPDGITWILGRAEAGVRAQRMQGEHWLDTVCEGPPARVLSHLLG
jgi:hypothetical protein